MAPRPPIANTYKLDLFSQSGDALAKAHNILYARPVATLGVSLTTLATDIEATWQATMLDVMSGNWEHMGTTVTALDGTDLQGFSSTAAAGGTIPGVPLPPQCAVCISWKIGSSYRGGRPRTYLSGIPSSIVSPPGSQFISSGFANAVVEGAEAFRAGLAGLGSGIAVTLGTVSYVSGGAPRVVPIWRPYIDGTSCHERLDSQRRRSGKESAAGISVG